MIGISVDVLRLSEAMHLPFRAQLHKSFLGSPNATPSKAAKAGAFLVLWTAELVPMSRRKAPVHFQLKTATCQP